MRSAALGFIAIFSVGCAAEPAPLAPLASGAPNDSPESNTATVDVAPEAAKPKPRVAPSLSGQIASRPFAAVSALMVSVNRPVRACSTKLTGTGSCSTDKDGFDITVSSLRIYERPVTCAELGDELRRREARVTAGERVIELELQAHWPVAAGSKWKIDQEGPPDPRQDNVQTTTFRIAGAQSSVLGYGEARFLAATPSEGTLAVDLTAFAPEAGAVHGAVPFKVCASR